MQQQLDQVLVALEQQRQHIAQLEATLKSTRAVLEQFMSGPYKQQREYLTTRVAPVVAAFEAQGTKALEPATTGTSKRRRACKADWRLVISLADSTKVAVIAKRTGISESTVRKYMKMTPEEVEALPEGEPMTLPEDPTHPDNATTQQGDATNAVA